MSSSRFTGRLGLVMLGGLALLPALAAHAQPLPPSGPPLLRLDSLVAAAAYHPTLRAIQLEAQALATRPAQVGALPDPVVMVTVQPLPLLTARGAQRSQWRVEQQVPYPGKRALQRDIATLSAEVARHEADTYAEALRLQVKQAYHELVRLQAQTALVEAFQQRLQAFEDVAATHYEVGTGTQQALLKAQLEKRTLTQRLLTLAQLRRTAVEALTALTGHPLDGPFRVHVDAPERPLADVERLTALALRQRPEAAALGAAAARADKQSALADRQSRPDLGVNVTYFDLAASDVVPAGTGRDALALGVSVKVPLQRGRLRAQREEAAVRAAQVGARQEALQRDIQAQIADLLSRLQQEAEQLALYQDILLPQAETTLEATLSAYTTGRTDFLNLLDTERTRFTLQMGYHDAHTRYLNAAAALERALGISDLADLETL